MTIRASRYVVKKKDRLRIAIDPGTGDPALTRWKEPVPPLQGRYGGNFEFRSKSVTICFILRPYTKHG